MKRRGQYHEPAINPAVDAQMRQMAAHDFQQHSGNSHFSGRDSVQTVEGQQYLSSKEDGQRQWDSKGLSQQLPYSYNEGEGADASRSSYEGQRSNSKLGFEKQTNKDARAQSHQDDHAGAGYGDNAILQTFEGLEQKFFHDIMSLLKEQQDAEDAENARHREKLSDINVRYQEKLLALRARQDAHREEFLRKESQARRQQYHQASIDSFGNNSGHGNSHGFASAPTVASAYGDSRRAYPPYQFDSYGERPEFTSHGGGGGGGGGGDKGRGRGDDHSRGQYPVGRAYNSSGRYF